MSIRPVTLDDLPAVAAIVDADRVPGQPPVTRRMVADAVAGHSVVDAGWWAELSGLRTDVLVDDAGVVVGAVGYAVRPRDGTLVLLWLHGGENVAVVRSLLHHVLDVAEARVIHAFSFATALSVGLEGLPVRHRPVTHRALLEAGFAHADLWRYLRLPMAERLPAAELSEGWTIHVSVSGDPVGWTLRLVDRSGTVAGEATVGVPAPGLGVLWWIGVEPSFRHRGWGRALLSEALELLYAHGAAEVVLVVDDDEPGRERDRTAANRLYDAAGFMEVDRLHSYVRRP